MAKRAQQLSLLKPSAKELGGSKLSGNPRHRRPFDSKKPLHVVLKSSLCKGRYSMLDRKYRKRIETTLFYYAKKNGLKIYRFQNVGNHLHIVLQTKNLLLYSRFIRAFSGRLAQVLLSEMGFKSLGGDPTEKQSGYPTKRCGGDSNKKQRTKVKFWDYRPFSRVVGWGKDFAIMKDYILKNTLDVLGVPRNQANLQALKISISVFKGQGPPGENLNSGKLNLQMSFV